MTDILDLIDGAIHDVETSADAMRWSPDPPPRPSTVPTAPPGLTDWQLTVLQEAFANLAAHMTELARAVFRDLGRAFAEIADLMDSDHLEPEDPRERALWLRRNRNTGPKTPPRAPRAINPTRSR
jgi:hypothetical protein